MDLMDNAQPCRDKWAWLVMGRVIYLCSPWDWETEGEGRSLYHHPNVAVLLHHYKQAVGMAAGE